MKKYLFRLALLPAMLIICAGCSPQSDSSANKIHKMKLSSYPAGSVAHVLGKTFDLPHEFSMSSGSYLFRIEKPGYAPAWFACRVQPSGITTAQTAPDGSVRWVPLKPASKQIELKKHGGTVLLLSNPSTAKVIKDGRNMGVTPLVLTDLPFGKHEVQLQSPNYAEVTVPWEIRDYSPMTVQTDLQSNIGHLELTSDPADARLFISGRFVGITPYKGTCAVGSHAIRILRDGFVPYDGFISVKKGEVTKQEFSLTVSPSHLNVHSAPAGGQVYLNGQLRGSTPLELKGLSAGKYQLVIAKDGYDQVEDTVELAPGQTLRKDYNLSSSQGGIELNIYPAGVSVYMNGKLLGVVQQGETKTQTELLRAGNLAPGVYVIKVVHKRADTEIRKIRVNKGQVARPPRIDLWVPNAEIVWRDTGKAEVGMIYGESDKIVLFGPEKGIRYEIDKKMLKSIKFLNINE